MKLKTLKDIEFYTGLSGDGTKICRSDLLRQEAIKRVKDCCPLKRDSISRCKGCERDIWFYNLTDEDLKND